MKFRDLALLAVVLVLLAAGCGGNDTKSEGVASMQDLSTETTVTTAAPSADAATASDESKVLEFAACMREQGIDFPDPVVDSDGNVAFDLKTLSKLADVDRDTLEKAFEPCAGLLEGVDFGFDRIFDAQFQDDLVAFSACMRANGFDLPDPDFAGLASGEPLYPSFDVNDPDFESAFDACRDTLPGIPGIAN
ncbi:MAG: hypothetical protein WBV06_12330 [Acidimicrobiia bacterium]